MWYKYSQDIEDIKKGEPEKATPEEFLQHHYTGYINSNAYQDYEKPNGLSWQKPEEFNIFIKNIDRNNMHFELKMRKDINYYCKKDQNGEIMRDEKGDAVYLTPEEIDAKGYEKYDITVGLIYNGKVVGFAADEFGASGVYLEQEFQGMGLGTLLMYEYLKQTQRLNSGRKIGQMTNKGYNMTKNIHKMIVEEALKQGKKVPENVLNYYPDLKSKYVV